MTADAPQAPPTPTRKKRHERLGPGRAEAVDTLILVSHQEEIPLFLRQKPHDLVLDARGVLRLVHAKIGEPLLPGSEHLRAAQQDLPRIDQLIVVVHEIAVLQNTAVFVIDRRDFDALGLELFDLLVRKHAVFNGGNRRLERLDGALRRKLVCLAAADFPQNRSLPPRIVQKPERFAPIDARIAADDAAGQAVDCAKLQLPRQILPEQARKPRAHGAAQQQGKAESHQPDVFALEADPQGFLHRNGCGRLRGCRKGAVADEQQPGEVNDDADHRDDPEGQLQRREECGRGVGHGHGHIPAVVAVEKLRQRVADLLQLRPDKQDIAVGRRNSDVPFCGADGRSALHLPQALRQLLRRDQHQMSFRLPAWHIEHGPRAAAERVLSVSCDRKLLPQMKIQDGLLQLHGDSPFPFA